MKQQIFEEKMIYLLATMFSLQTCLMAIIPSQITHFSHAVSISYVTVSVTLCNEPCQNSVAQNKKYLFSSSNVGNIYGVQLDDSFGQN